MEVTVRRRGAAVEPAVEGELNRLMIITDEQSHGGILKSCRKRVAS
jgi:hypothetical protein